MHTFLTWILFFSCVSLTVRAQGPFPRPRDGLITDIPGWTGMSYHSVRWEPLCGTIGTPPGAVLMDYGPQCIDAINSYTNDTVTTLAYYDESGVKLIGAGVGLGKALCMCFSMADQAAIKYDICWYFYGDGRYSGDGNGFPWGTFRLNGIKSLPQCANVNVPSLIAQWSQTAIMPTYTGANQTVNMQPTTYVQTVTQTQTYVLTPTLVNLTIASSTVLTDSNGHLTTQDQTYTTTLAVINYTPDNQRGLTTGNRIALGIGLGLGLPTLMVAVGAWCWNRR